MMTAIIILHGLICLLLIIIILIQAGRGGGFVESLSGVESMFGTKTSSFLTKATSVLATLFFITCISLAFMSAQRGKSLLRNVKTAPAQNAPIVDKAKPLAAPAVAATSPAVAAPAAATTPAAGKPTETK